MPLMLACREAGVDCDFVARDATADEVMRAAAEHGRTVHGYTDAQLNDPEMQQTMRGLVREERL